MSIYGMLHRTIWLSMAAELLVSPKLSVSGFKGSALDALGLYPSNFCILCEIAGSAGCFDCQLYCANFDCGKWYSTIVNTESKLSVRFLYAICCAQLLSPEEIYAYAYYRIIDVMELLKLKNYKTDYETALHSLLEILPDIPMSDRDRFELETLIKEALDE